MRRGIWITLLALVAFVAIVVARLPASWVVPAPPAAVSCSAVDGTIWNGVCAGLSADGAPLGDVTWNVHAWSLLSGKLSAYMELTGPVAAVSGDFDMALDKSITLHNVQASVPLDQGIKRLMPALQTLSGSANANIISARYTKGFLTQIQGRIEAHDLVSHDRDGVATLGSYAVTFPAPSESGDPTGQLQDLSGPLAVQGTLRVMQDKPGVEVHGLVAPRAEATPDLRHQLEYLGSPDAQGRREFGPISYYF
ncbi:MAG TPA: type II secretion system protein N [Steroidobacteraceae bacterium]